MEFIDKATGTKGEDVLFIKNVNNNEASLLEQLGYHPLDIDKPTPELYIKDNSDIMSTLKNEYQKCQTITDITNLHMAYMKHINTLFKQTLDRILKQAESGERHEA